MKWRLSIYGRTLVSISLAILIIFSVLAVVYTSISSATSKQLRLDDLERNANELADLTARHMQEGGRIFITAEVSGYWTYAARSTGAIVCIIDGNNHIVYDTGLPAYLVEQLEYDVAERYFVLPNELTNRGRSNYSSAAEQTGLNEYLDDSSSWLVASSPLPSYTRVYTGEVLLLRHLRPDSFTALLQENSIPISFFISFLLSLIIIVLLSRRITEPISTLALTADKVYKGDLSARVKLGKEEQPLTLDDGDEDLARHEDDLTLLVRTFNTLIAKFEEQERQQSDFLSSISHDLRTPITSIHGFIEAMRDGTIPPERYPHYLDIVKSETERLRQLIDTLFDQTLDGNINALNRSVFNINNLIIRIVNSLEPLLKGKNLTLELQLSDGEGTGYNVIADEDAITRVLSNILTNAIRFAPQSGLVLVRTSLENRLVHVAVEDNGEGISDEDIPYIFDRFYKAERSRSTEGSGLGLYIARTLIKRHGQLIKAYHSDLGGAGIMFTLERP
ncbi:MAG: HAMP domain-containing sensor histidine kinase [Eubacteriales bacterium]|nr:HAMP domain-containing sensor histidine kinase [Eubacteriales bacterium]MDD4324572.1 HAMP domain-containing sensor histidine kinase [Eubacteriales bacterium]MDD4541597.1 HAMP domain-containing sensor histidine kinase [Eubacteriales bacterium]